MTRPRRHRRLQATHMHPPAQQGAPPLTTKMMKVIPQSCCSILFGCIWYTCVHYNLLPMHATVLIEVSVNIKCMPNQDQCTLENPQLPVVIAAICTVIACYFHSIADHQVCTLQAQFVFRMRGLNVCLVSGKMPEEAKEVQMSGQQQGPQARSKQGAESQDGNKSTHQVSEKL